MTHPHTIHSDQMYRHSRGGACLVGFAMAMHLTAGQDGKHGLAVGLPYSRLTVHVDDLPVNLAGRNCPVLFQCNSNRRDYPSLSRRQHGVERFPSRSAVRTITHREHHTDCQVSDAPKHFHRVLSCSTPLVSPDANGKDLTRGSQSLSSDDKTYD